MAQPHGFVQTPPSWLPIALATAGIAAVIGAGLLLPLAWLMTVVGSLVSIVLGLSLANYLRTIPQASATLLETIFSLVRDREVSERFHQLANSFLKISRQRDDIFRNIALEHLDDLERRAANIASGSFVFEGTEAWRIAYEQLLRSPGLHQYRSVAWITNENYWQDEPGRKSMAVNFELHEAERLNIERIAIIADELWPAGEVWPAELVRQWLHEQHARGIWIMFTRQSDLANEPELLADIGIYGSRALGTQELDEHCRTTRFYLTFDFQQVVEAQDRWNRLALYAESFAGYLDRFEMPG